MFHVLSFPEGQYNLMQILPDSGGYATNITQSAEVGAEENVATSNLIDSNRGRDTTCLVKGLNKKNSQLQL